MENNDLVITNDVLHLLDDLHNSLKVLMIIEVAAGRAEALP